MQRRAIERMHILEVHLTLSDNLSPRRGDCRRHFIRGCCQAVGIDIPDDLALRWYRECEGMVYTVDIFQVNGHACRLIGWIKVGDHQVLLCFATRWTRPGIALGEEPLVLQE